MSYGVAEALAYNVVGYPLSKVRRALKGVQCLLPGAACLVGNIGQRKGVEMSVNGEDITEKFVVRRSQVDRCSDALVCEYIEDGGSGSDW